MTRLLGALIVTTFRAAVAYKKTLSVAVALGLAFVAYGVWLDWDSKAMIGWKALEGYIDPAPDDTTGNKDAVQVYAVIVAGVIASITAAVGLANLRLTRKNLELQRELEAQRAEQQRELAQGTALQAYYEQIGKLLTEHDLRTSQLEDITELARGQTLTVLQEVDGNGKGSLLTFLHGAGLIRTGNPAVALTGADLRGADLQGADLQRANLQRANLRGANLPIAILQEAILYQADLRGADLQGANLQETMLRETNLQEADLQRADLRGANLKGADLPIANLQEAILYQADLRGANFPEAILREADLKGAILQEADLREAILKGADLQKANLQEAILQGAILYKADLRGANLLEADLRGANLQGVKVTDEQLAATLSLQGVTMPDGSKHT